MAEIWQRRDVRYSPDQIPMTRAPWFPVLMLVFAVAVVVLSVIGFYIAGPYR